MTTVPGSTGWQSTSGVFHHAFRINPDDQCALLERLIDDPDGTMEGPGSRILKHDGTTTLSLLSEPPHHWVVKRYNNKNTWHAVRRAVRESRAGRCWRVAPQLRVAGIATPAPVAAVEKRCGPLKGIAYYVMQWVDGVLLAEYLQQCPDLTVPARAVGTLFQQLYRAGITHGDMKDTNILIHDARPVLLDLDAVRVHQSGASLRRGYQRDRSRFLQNWSDAATFDAFAQAIPEVTALP